MGSRYMKSVIYHAPETALENLYVIFGQDFETPVRPSHVNITRLQFALDAIFHAVLP